MDLHITDRCPPELISRFELYMQDRCANLAVSLGAPALMPCARCVEPCEAVCKFIPFAVQPRRDFTSEGISIFISLYLDTSKIDIESIYNTMSPAEMSISTRNVLTTHFRYNI